MLIYIILGIVIVFLAIVFCIYVINYNKFQVSIIKISEAEENIGLLLKEKYQILLKIDSLMKQKNKDNAFDEINKLSIDEMNKFDLSKELSKYDKNVFEIIDYNKDIEFVDEECKVFDEFENNNVECMAAEKYYNDNVVIFNRLVNCFPSNIIAKFKKYKNKDFYSNEKEEIFEILKK